ncbi:hypothetical protein CFK38_03330 [Brachybacterium vulturis]|uniref:Proteinase inhibitor I42 chagasin domain-containing protein n=1 Tax=Brachybacterium vulturis TaxID=2017484 RepID=A0A291GKE8_9MICO|nr:hypothetical protein [Brachybacterium vulturis]ATG50658.1 hypothetical protein CFK38_03330 [Brachybacterium vulturis]
MTLRTSHGATATATTDPARGRAARALTLLVGAALLAGCGVLGGGSGDDPALLVQGTTEVQLAVGETAQVSLGEGSQGIGDDWGVISQTDATVAEASVVMDEEVFGTDEGQDAPGASMPYAVELTGRQPGTTTVRVLYCTRTEIAEDCDQSQGTLDAPVAPVEITVVVE